jgi:glutamate:Na+ symporter, ESS family
MSVTSDLIALGVLPSLLAACLVLLVGGALTQRVGCLARYSIPGPIIGGLVFAVLAMLLATTYGTKITLDTGSKSTLLLLFFASIGLTADLALLRSGGVRLLRFLVALFPFLIMQDAVGVGMAWVLGLHPLAGLSAGSITLVGGHGTGAAYAERFASDHGIPGIMEFTMTSATLGLVVGGVIGGPVANYLLRRTGRPAQGEGADGGPVGGPVSSPVTMLALIGSLAAGLVAIMAGVALDDIFRGGMLTVPSFLWCLIVGLVLRNGGALIGLRLHDAASDLIGSVCLSLFLAWTMMALDLKSVVLVAGPLLIILAAQTVLVAAWAIFVCFRAVGRDYESAVMSGAFCGFAMGATATAIANMQAITRTNGPAPQAFVIVPVVGAFFIDLMNAVVLTGFLSLPFMTA